MYNKFSKRGFTLIELLVVIGVLAVIAAGVVALINPQQKILQASDAKVISDIGQIATAMQSYAVQNNGAYPTLLTQITASGELNTLPVPPAGSGYGSAYTISTTTTTNSNDTSVVSGRLVSLRQDAKCATATDVPWWSWSSTRGTACGVCTGASPAVPSAASACSFTF